MSRSTRPPRHPPGPTDLVARFRRAREGATAVEFALLAIPFFALIGAIVDTSLTLWASQTLDDALGDAARLIQTGQFQNANVGVTSPTTLIDNLRQQVCQSNGTARPTLFDCTAVKVQVQTFSSLAGSTSDSPVDATTNDWSSNFGTKYANPGAGTIVVVQAAVKYPTWMNVLNVTPKFADGSHLLQSVAVFRTEPF